MQVVPKPVSQIWQTLQTWLHPYTAAVTQWPEQAKQQSRCKFINQLADEVAHDLMANKPRHLSMEELSRSVTDCTSSSVQQRAEHFLRNLYYGYPDGAHYCRLISIFRHLIQKKLANYELH